MIGVHVQAVVDGDDLEVLVRAYHRWIDEDEGLFHWCACGWRRGGEDQHRSHVDHAVREALAGRILL